MANSSIVVNNMNWCIPWTRDVYIYGLIIPGIILFIFGLTFNPLALYYFSTSRNFRRSTYSYYFSAIAVVDLVRLTIWFLFLLFDYQIFKLQLYSFECSIQTFFESITSSISAWLAVSLTVERCLVIYRPLQTINDTPGKRALIIIFSVILTSCIINSLVLHPEFYKKRVYIEDIRTIICYYNERSSGQAQDHLKRISDMKRIYLLIIVILRIVVPFILLLTANFVLFISVRTCTTRSSKSEPILLVRHGHHRKITPMIFFSSCMLLLTITPRYLLQFSVNFFQAFDNCSLIHFAPHLLKTLELFNYSFNVFISIISGKHSRHELYQMLSCQRRHLRSKFRSNTIDQTSVFIKLQDQRRSSQLTDRPSKSTHRLLLTNEYS